MTDSKTYYDGKDNYVNEESGTFGFLNDIQSRYTKVDPTSYLRRSTESGFHYWGRRLGSLKPVELLLAEYDKAELKKYLSWWQLIFIGIGSIIGTGMIAVIIL